MPSKKKKTRDTHRGFSAPGDRVSVAERDEQDTERSLPPAEVRAASAPSQQDVALDIEQVHETGSPALLSGPWRAIEVWTRNRIYGVDGAMICRSVTDRVSARTLTDHPTLGARLIGGQRRDDQGRILWVAHPLPARGGAAVFAQGFGKRLKVSETSDVTRVVVRQRVVTVAPGDEPPRWDEVTGD